MLIKYLVIRKSDTVHWTNGHRLNIAYPRGNLPQPMSPVESFISLCQTELFSGFKIQEDLGWKCLPIQSQKYADMSYQEVRLDGEGYPKRSAYQVRQLVDDFLFSVNTVLVCLFAFSKCEYSWST